jgi:hypothetical protein
MAETGDSHCQAGDSRSIRAKPRAGTITTETKATMGEVVRLKRPAAREKAEGKTLCKSGFHKWRVVTERQFDVKQGRLVTLLRCARCREEKIELR